MSAESSTFLSLGIAPELVERLQQLGIQTPTDVQAQAIPHVLEGKDVLAGAQTGTGKTAAFGLPLIQRFLDNPAPREATVRIFAHWFWFRLVNWRSKCSITCKRMLRAAS